MQPDFDRAERHARELDGEDDSKRRAAEEPVAPEADGRSAMDVVEEAAKDHKVAGTVGAVTGAVTGTVLGGPPGTVVGAAAGAVRGVIAAEAFDRVKERIEKDDPASAG